MNPLPAALQAIEIPSDTSSARLPAAVKAGLLYRAGKWDQAHSIAQDIHSAEGSFWHAILHRSEGDWSNSAYWFRKVGSHAAYPSIHADTLRVLASQPEAGWNAGEVWDPFRFNEWCRQAAALPASKKEEIVIQIQVSEWKHLFERCLR